MEGGSWGMEEAGAAWPDGEDGEGSSSSSENSVVRSSSWATSGATNGAPPKAKSQASKTMAKTVAAVVLKSLGILAPVRLPDPIS
jgi:hypothetical protein